MKELLCIIGIVLVLEGMPYFISPRGMKTLMEAIPKVEDGTLRWWGFFAMLLGLVLVYLGRR